MPVEENEPPFQGGVSEDEVTGIIEEVPGGVADLEQPAQPYGPSYSELGFQRDYDQSIFVAKAEEIPFTGRRGTPFTATMRRDYTRRFRVIVNRPDVSSVHVCYAPGLPLPFSPYYPDPTLIYPDLLALMWSMSADVELGDDWQSWVVTCNYSTDMPDEGAFRGETNLPDRIFGQQNVPWEEKPEISWDAEVVQLATVKDLDGKWFLNSARQAYTPAPSIDVECEVLVLKRKERQCSRQVLAKYGYALNQDIFEGADPFMAQCLPIRAKQRWRGSLGYWDVEIRIRFAPLDKLPDTDPDDPNGSLFTWQPRILDAGLYQLNSPSVFTNPFTTPPDLNTLVPIIVHGLPTSQPILLDGSGRRKKPDVGGPNDGKIVPVYNNYRLRRAVEFGTLLTTGLVP